MNTTQTIQYVGYTRRRYFTVLHFCDDTKIYESVLPSSSSLIRFRLSPWLFILPFLFGGLIAVLMLRLTFFFDLVTSTN